MRRALTAMLFLFVLLLGSVTVFHYHFQRREASVVKEDILDREALRRFLESQYIKEIGLLRASTHTYPDNVTVYIANDNVLAARALSVLESPLASRVRSVLDREYWGGWNDKIDVLVGKSISDVFYASRNEIIGEVDGYKIIWQGPNYSRPMNDWYNYSDLLVYHALNNLLNGLLCEAERSFLNLTAMWDGYGFRDAAFEYTIINSTGMPLYNVYKCALFVYLYKALVYAGSSIVDEYYDVYNECINIILQSQNPVDGGIYTSYTVRDGEVVILKGGSFDMNTETTSIVILALYSDYPSYIGGKALGSWHDDQTKQ